MVYTVDGVDTEATAFVAIADYTDPITCTIYSTNGNQFTNNAINTTLICRVFNNDGEVDSYTEGKAQDAYLYSYTWVRLNQNGQPDTNWRDGATVTGKSITLSHEDVNVKGVFSCTVTKTV
jgi:hypothetical protein